MQPVLQGYLGLLQGEKLHLYSIKNDRETTMVIYYRVKNCIFIQLKTIEKLQWSFIWRHGL